MPDVQTKEEWVVVWFPHDFPERRKSFKSEEAAQTFAESEDLEGFAPLIEYRYVVTSTTSHIVPLRGAS